VLNDKQHPDSDIPFSINLALTPEVIHFFDEETNTFSYIVRDPESQACAIIDAVLEYDYASGRTSSIGADKIISHIKDKGWQLEWLIETHVHADHLTAAPYIQNLLGGKILIGKMITAVQETFAQVFNTQDDFAADGSQFDQLLSDGDSYQIGNMTAHALHTPGHTPACMSHIIGNAVFVGDTIFMPDGGTARADFPGGDARILFQSIRRLLSLPDEMTLYMCHDYPQNRGIGWRTTVAEEKQNNIHVSAQVSEDDFVSMREARDNTLDLPHLIIPSLQVNMRAGHFPEAENNGVIYLKVPLNTL